MLASLPGQLTAALLAFDLPAASAAELAAAADHVQRSVGTMPDVARRGLGVASVPVVVLLSLAGRGWFPRLPLQRQAVAAARVSRLRLPVVAEYVRLARGLGLVAVFEGRASGAGL